MEQQISSIEQKETNYKYYTLNQYQDGVDSSKLSQAEKIKSLYIKARSPINIALVKYWGKIEDNLIIPTNSSLSMTIDINSMCSETVISLVNQDAQNSNDSITLMLNGESSKVTKRIQNVVSAVKEAVKKLIESGQTDKLDTTFYLKDSFEAMRGPTENELKFAKIEKQNNSH